MLISFSVKNWQSFREKATLSMIAGREKQHSDRLSKIDKYNMKLLPLAAIYGANAAGKTKFYNSLKFAKSFIIKVSQPESSIPREHFKLDSNSKTQPSVFIFELLIDDSFYEYSFSVTDKKVVEEKLSKISLKREEKLFVRKQDDGVSFFSKDLTNNDRLKFVAQGTRDNQLFLTNSVNQKLNEFEHIYNWFKHSLILMSPNSIFSDLIDLESMSEAISKLDTGINKLIQKNISLDDLDIPKEIKNKLIEKIKEDLESGALVRIHSPERIIIDKVDGIPVAKKIVPHHKSMQGEDIPFEFDEESAGTIRIMELLPVFLDLLKHNKSKVYFIDELDRCLNTLMTRNFIKTYLSSCTQNNRSQLVFTTHDVLLMDQNLLRRDEMWITERDNRGCSSLISFGEYKNVRADKDIRKSYLKGHLGGIPKVFKWTPKQNISNSKNKS